MTATQAWSPPRKRQRVELDTPELTAVTAWCANRYEERTRDVRMTEDKAFVVVPRTWDDSPCQNYLLSCDSLFEVHNLMNHVQEQVQLHQVWRYARHNILKYKEDGFQAKIFQVVITFWKPRDTRLMRVSSKALF